MSTEANKAVVRSFVEAWNTKDFDASSVGMSGTDTGCVASSLAIDRSGCSFRGHVEHDLAMEDRGRWWVFDRPLWRDPLFVIGIGVGLISVVSVILLRDEYGTGAFVFACSRLYLLASSPRGS